MRVLNLAKEIGVSYERLLRWMSNAGISCDGPESEIEPAQEAKARRAFSGSGPKATKKKKSKRANVDIDALLAAEVDGGLDEEEFDLPDSLEELEAIEKELMKAAPELRDEKPKPVRVSTRSVLDGYGIQGRAPVRKLRKLLPGNVVRLLNQHDLSEAQRATLTQALEEHAALCCDHPYCRSATAERHTEEMIIPVRDAGACAVCRGSATRRSLDEVSEVCRRAGVRRILIVGGGPSSHSTIRQSTPGNVEFRLVEGDLERGSKRVQADLRWCDLAVIWGSTILGHSVSGGYTRRKGAGGPFIVRVNRRSVEALCTEVVKHLRDRSTD